MLELLALEGDVLFALFDLLKVGQLLLLDCHGLIALFDLFKFDNE